jgi:hypothetical protein
MAQKKSSAGGGSPKRRRTHGYRGYGSGFARGTDQYGGGVHWGRGFAGVGAMEGLSGTLPHAALVPEVVRHGYSGLAPRGYVRPDERVREEICDELTRRADIDPRRIDVRVVDGEVVLEGEVEDAAARSAVAEIAARCAGVTAVVDRLGVLEKEITPPTRGEAKKNHGAH